MAEYDESNDGEYRAICEMLLRLSRFIPLLNANRCGWIGHQYFALQPFGVSFIREPRNGSDIGNTRSKDAIVALFIIGHLHSLERI